MYLIHKIIKYIKYMFFSKNIRYIKYVFHNYGADVRSKNLNKLPRQFIYHLSRRRRFETTNSTRMESARSTHDWRSRQQWRLRLCACVKAAGSHFEHSTVFCISVSM